MGRLNLVRVAPWTYEFQWVHIVLDVCETTSLKCTLCAPLLCLLHLLRKQNWSELKKLLKVDKCDLYKDKIKK